MARFTDIAAQDWDGPADNFGDGDYVQGEAADRMAAVLGGVVHIAEGSYAGTDSWENNPGSDISSTFIVAKDGRIRQMLDTLDYSWCQADGNRWYASIENEGRAGDSLTPAQVEANARILAALHQAHGVPLQLANAPGERGLGYHGMGGAAWGGHTGCPGPAIVAQRGAIVARAQQIIGGDGMELTEQMTLTRYYPGGLQNATETHSVGEVLSIATQAALVAMGAAQTAVSKTTTIAADVAEIKARPAPSATLTQADRDAIAAQAAAAIGAQLAELEQRLDALISARVAAAAAEAGALTS